MHRQSIVILGNGYIGSSLFNHLNSTKQPDTNVVVVDKKTLNYTNSSILRTYLEDIKGNSSKKVIVINCCGFTGKPNVDACEKQENKQACWDLNAMLPARISAICRDLDVFFIHISSGCIYNGYDKMYTEEDEPNFGMMSNTSSFYSKTKHAGEIYLKSIDYGKVLRIRMPFCSNLESSRNLINKIIKYQRLISVENSLTCIDDLNVFIKNYITYHLTDGRYEVFNVVNEGISTARAISTMLDKPDGWLFCDEAALELAAKRSNVILSTRKIKELGLQLPEVSESLFNCILKGGKVCAGKV